MPFLFSREAHMPRFLFLVEPNFGRFSNNRMSFAEALGIAAYTKRSLYMPHFRSCDDAPGPSSLWNLSFCGATLGIDVYDDFLSDARVAELCPEHERIYIWAEGHTNVYLRGSETPIGEDSIGWRGVELEKQEVLSRTVLFIGNSLSTFSIAALWRYVGRNLSHHIPLFPEGPNPPPMTSFFS